MGMMGVAPDAAGGIDETAIPAGASQTMEPES